MNKTITNIIDMTKKAVKKIAAKKSDKPKADKAQKVAKMPAKESAKTEAQKEVPVVPVVHPAPEVAAAKPDVDQWKKDHVAKNKIKRPYFHFKGGIYRTSDGKLFANPEEFFAAGGSLDQVHGN